MSHGKARGISRNRYRPNRFVHPWNKGLGAETRIDIGRKKNNPFGYGINFWKAPAKMILSSLERHFVASEQVRLLFTPDKVVIEDTDMEIDMLQGKFVSRSFRHAGYRSLRIPPELRWDNDAKSYLKTLLKFAEEEKVNELRAHLANNPGFVLEGLPAGEPVSALISGIYKHYTDYEGFHGIMERQTILGGERKKDGIKDFWVSVTRLSLSPTEAENILFTEKEREARPGRGEYVVAFNLKTGSPAVQHLRSDSALEGWIDGNLSLNDVEVTYAGENRLSA
jgi:hypothetical protein